MIPLAVRTSACELGCRGRHVLYLNLAPPGNAVYVDNYYDRHLGHAHNIEIHRVTTTNAYRNGLSIISAKNLLVSNCSFLNTSGTPPMAGIDIEPDMAFVGPRGSCASWPFKGVSSTEQVTYLATQLRQSFDKDTYFPEQVSATLWRT